MPIRRLKFDVQCLPPHLVIMGMDAQSFQNYSGHCGFRINSDPMLVLISGASLAQDNIEVFKDWGHQLAGEFLAMKTEPKNYGQNSFVKTRAVTRVLIWGGGIFIHSCSVRLFFFESLPNNLTSLMKSQIIIVINNFFPIWSYTLNSYFFANLRKYKNRSLHFFLKYLSVWF